MKRVLVALLVCFSGIAGATGDLAPSKTQVYVEQSGTDEVGTQFAYDFREAIRRSAGFELVDREPFLFATWVAKYSSLHVELVSATLESGPARHQIGAISVVTKASYPDNLTGVEIQHEVVLVGNNPAEIDKAAQGVLATLDAQLTANRQGSKIIDEATKKEKR